MWIHSAGARCWGLGFEATRFRGGLVFEAHRLVYHSTLGLSVIKKKKHLCEDHRSLVLVLEPYVVRPAEVQVMSFGGPCS